MSGCFRPYLNEDYLTSSEIIDYGWASDERNYIPPQVYCYKSIGTIDCFQAPQKGRQHQLVNFYQVQHKCDLDERYTLKETCSSNLRSL